MLFICYRYPNIVDESTFSVLSNWLSKPLSHQGKLFKGNMLPSYKGGVILTLPIIITLFTGHIFVLNVS